MAAVETEADDKFANVDVDNILSRVGRSPMTCGKARLLCRAPEFTKRLTGEHTVNEGDAVQLQVTVSGFPNPVLRWYKEEQEIVDHPRISVDSTDDGVHVFSLQNVNKGDEAAYRCRAENEDGVTSCLFFLHVIKCKSRGHKKKNTCKRSVSYPPMFPTIVEKVEEEEKEGKETSRSPPSPLTQLYDGLTLQTRHTWPKFLGDWAYVDSTHRNGESLGSESESESDDVHSVTSIEHDDVFHDDPQKNPLEQGQTNTTFYLSSEEPSPVYPGRMEEDFHQVPLDSNTTVEVTHKSGQTQVDVVNSSEPINNGPKASKSKRIMHLPLNGDSVLHKDGKDENETKTVIKKKALVTSGKTTDGKRNTEPKKADDSDKPTKRTVHKVARKSNSVDKSVDKSANKEKHGVSRTESRDSEHAATKSKENSKTKSSDGEKSQTNTKSVKQVDSHKTSSAKKKPENKVQTSQNKNTADPPILGTARPLVVTNMASKIARKVCTTEVNGKANPPKVSAAHGVNGNQSNDYTTSTERHDSGSCVTKDTDSPVHAEVLPFSRFCEEFVFVLCLFTFLSLCIGIPIETFVLIVLGMHLGYSIITIHGLC